MRKDDLLRADIGCRQCSELGRRLVLNTCNLNGPFTLDFANSGSVRVL